MCGYVPFGERTDDPLEIYEDLLNSELKFPGNLKDNKARKLMEQLLNKEDPDSRMGGPSLTSLKNNPWLEKINWVLKYLHRKKYFRKVWLPQISSTTRTSRRAMNSCWKWSPRDRTVRNSYPVWRPMHRKTQEIICSTPSLVIGDWVELGGWRIWRHRFLNYAIWVFYLISCIGVWK